MIDGLTVLYQETCSTGLGVDGTWTMIILVAGTCFVLTVLTCCNSERLRKYWGLIFIGMCVITIPICVFLDRITTVEWIQYKVTISKSVDYKEFTDKYKVIAQEGDIYTIMKKDNK